MFGVSFDIGGLAASHGIETPKGPRHFPTVGSQGEAVNPSPRTWQRAMASRGRPVQSTPPPAAKSGRSSGSGSDRPDEATPEDRRSDEATPGNARHGGVDQSIDRSSNGGETMDRSVDGGETWEGEDMVPRAEVERMRRDFEVRHDASLGESSN